MLVFVDVLVPNRLQTIPAGAAHNAEPILHRLLGRCPQPHGRGAAEDDEVGIGGQYVLGVQTHRAGRTVRRFPRTRAIGKIFAARTRDERPPARDIAAARRAKDLGGAGFFVVDEGLRAADLCEPRLQIGILLIQKGGDLVRLFFFVKHLA